MVSMKWAADCFLAVEHYRCREWLVTKEDRGWQLSGPLIWPPMPLYDARDYLEAQRAAEQIIAARLREALAEVEGGDDE